MTTMRGGAAMAAAAMAALVGGHGGAAAQATMRTVTYNPRDGAGSQVITGQTKPVPIWSMDVWTPPGQGTNNRPVVLMIHPGSFSQGDKSWYDNPDPTFPDVPPGTKGFAEQLSEAYGYYVATLDYRLASTGNADDKVGAAGPRTAQINDVQLAIRYLRSPDALAQGFHIDPGKMCLDGWSAGGTLALMAGIGDGANAVWPANQAEPDIKNQTDVTGPRYYPAISDAVTCIVSNSGPVQEFYHGGSLLPLTLDGYKPPGPIVLSLIRQAITALQAKGGRVPTLFLTHGHEDALIPFSDAQAMKSVADNAGISVKSIFYTGGHMMGSSPFPPDTSLTPPDANWYYPVDDGLPNAGTACTPPGTGTCAVEQVYPGTGGGVEQGYIATENAFFDANMH